MQFIITKSTPFMITSMGYGTYFFFAASMTVSFAWVWFLLPETRGLHLEDMDVIFGFPGSHNTIPEQGSDGKCERTSDEKNTGDVEQSLDV